jgi:hypothetical protein
MKLKRDENGVVLPVKTTAAPAESVPKPEIKEEEDYNNSSAAKPQQEKEKTDTSAAAKPIGEEEIFEARQKLSEWMASKKAYDQRYKNNFDTYNLMYTENDAPDVYKDDNGELKKRLIPKKTGAQCLNVIMNKHADAMDNYPEAVCLPRAKDDEKTAKILNSVLPCVMERNGFRKTWNRSWTNKLVGGTGGYCVLWDSDKENGLGDISITKLDILSIFWEPHIEDLQDSSDIFYLKLYNIDEVKRIYPQLEDVSQTTLDIEEYRTYDNNNKKSNKAVIVDWYYKKDRKLHFAKFCGDTLLFASENEPETYPNGFYEHGKYPFFIDPMFWMNDTPVGFGFVDICRWPQRYLDELKVDILKNVKVNSQTRNLVDTSAGVDINDLNDLDKDFVEADKISDITRPIESKDIASGALNMYNALINEMKETTGTNDASNGASAAGVTSGSAIAALQEAGGKISRDLNKAGYDVFVDVCECVIELMRQFYTLPRYFRITGEDNQTEYVEFYNNDLQKSALPFEGEDDGSEIFQRLPIFDIKVKAQKQSPFAVAANNEMMMSMFNAGMFRADNVDASLIALEGMSFEGKDKIVEMLKQYKTIEQTCQELYNQLQMTNAMLASNEAQSSRAMLAQSEPQVPAMPQAAPTPQGAAV